ncbi:MAG: hypothetical protein M3Z02_03655 [Actinomycetota bacterium]|nr:hypothetical protein [Actinomycetota bacterium]
MTVTDYDEIVAALRAVPGVAEADVQPDHEGGGMGLLRLGLRPGVDEVAVATTVGRLLRERFGLGVDAERVQLIEDTAGLVEQMPAEPMDDAGDAVDADTGSLLARPSIQRMHLASAGLDITASVSLGHGGRSATGEATGTATQTGVQRAVASATLRAAEALTGDSVRFELDHLEVTSMGHDRTVVIAVTLLSSSGSERLTGAAGVREDVRQAVIRASLDAVNRRLQALLG